MPVNDVIATLRDNTAWAILVFMVLGGMKQVWVWGWLYTEKSKQVDQLQAKLDAYGQKLDTMIATLDHAVEVAQSAQNEYEAKIRELEQGGSGQSTRPMPRRPMK